MKEIILNKLEIRNFKGLSDEVITFGLENTDIYGDNATGKTTVFDAFMWLLFGKDSENQAAFGIKPVNEDGEVANPGTISSVTAYMTVDGEEVQLSKDYQEVWKKKRGSAQKTREGNTTKYFVDGIPKSKAAYGKFINSIIDEDKFRQFTSPDYFASVLDWRKRRQVLLELAGDVSDTDVMAQDPEQLECLKPLLAKHSYDDVLKRLKSDRSIINKELGELPVRIDEAKRSLPEVGDTDLSEAQIKYDAAEERVQELRQKLAAMDSAGDGQRSILKARIKNFREEIAQAAKRAEMDYASKQRLYESDKYAHEHNVWNLQMGVEDLQPKLEHKKGLLTEMRETYRSVNAETWNDADNLCPTCGQPIPEDQLEARKKQFEADKLLRLKDLQKNGQGLSDDIQHFSKELGKMTKEIEQEKAALDALQQPEKPVVSTEDTPEIKELVAQLEALDNAEAADRESDRIREQIEEARKESARYLEIIAAHTSAASLQERITQLEDEEKHLAQEIEALDRQIFACEQFVRVKTDLLESKINKLFNVARWRLFKEQINGGVEEVCDLTVNGVPWQDLNNAMRINAGLDVINTLSGFYGVTAPVFIDNAEGIVEMEPLAGQRIRLIVSGDDKSLRVVSDADETVEVA